VIPQSDETIAGGFGAPPEDNEGENGEGDGLPPVSVEASDDAEPPLDIPLEAFAASALIVGGEHSEAPSEEVVAAAMQEAGPAPEAPAVPAPRQSKRSKK
jgi:hypothetical protein